MAFSIYFVPYMCFVARIDLRFRVSTKWSNVCRHHACNWYHTFSCHYFRVLIRNFMFILSSFAGISTCILSWLFIYRFCLNVWSLYLSKIAIYLIHVCKQPIIYFFFPALLLRFCISFLTGSLLYLQLSFEWRIYFCF